MEPDDQYYWRVAFRDTLSAHMLRRRAEFAAQRLRRNVVVVVECDKAEPSSRARLCY